MLIQKRLQRRRSEQEKQPLPVPQNSQETAAVAVLETKNQCSKDAATGEQLSAMALGRRQTDRNPQSSARAFLTRKCHHRRKVISDNRFVIGVGCRDATTRKPLRQERRWRTSAPVLRSSRNPLDLIAQGRPNSRVRTSSSAAFRHYSRKVRRVSPKVTEGRPVLSRNRGE